MESNVAALKTRAGQGDAQAQETLGFVYKWNQGVKQDYAEAVKCFLRASDQERRRAQHELGRLHYAGKGVKQDYQEAYFWFRISDPTRTNPNFLTASMV